MPVEISAAFRPANAPVSENVANRAATIAPTYLTPNAVTPTATTPTSKSRFSANIKMVWATASDAPSTPFILPISIVN